MKWEVMGSWSKVITDWLECSYLHGLTGRADTLDWHFANEAKNGEKCKIFRGEILSGPSNIQSDAELIELFPRALGGERQGVASSALTSQSVQWMVVHGISQFNSSLGTEPENSSDFAVSAAVSVCHHILSRHCLGELQCRNISN